MKSWWQTFICTLISFYNKHNLLCMIILELFFGFVIVAAFFYTWAQIILMIVLVVIVVMSVLDYLVHNKYY